MALSTLVINALERQIRELKKILDQHAPPLEFANDYETYLTGFVSGGMFMLVKTWLENDMRETPEEIASLAFLVLQNLGSSPTETHAVIGDSTCIL